ncbi:alpha/beta fold hydrolase [Rhizobium cremeum]|uniref:alpha/beta fold hydrolase n=1 Tax=Rhizobium cremeum TaxID=2813827 RepID=UPI000DE1C86B
MTASTSFRRLTTPPDLKAIDKPTLIIHGADDQIVPIKVSGELSAKLVRGATLKIYQSGSHGLAQVDAERFNADLQGFIEN